MRQLQYKSHRGKCPRPLLCHRVPKVSSVVATFCLPKSKQTINHIAINTLLLSFQQKKKNTHKLTNNLLNSNWKVNQHFWPIEKKLPYKSVKKQVTLAVLSYEEETIYCPELPSNLTADTRFWWAGIVYMQHLLRRSQILHVLSSLPVTMW